MTEKPNGGIVTLREQIIDDLVTGIIVKIERTTDGEGRIRLYGNIEHGHRDFAFDAGGRLVGTGTGTRPSCVDPTWLRVIEGKQ